MATGETLAISRAHRYLQHPYPDIGNNPGIVALIESVEIHVLTNPPLSMTSRRGRQENEQKHATSRFDAQSNCTSILTQLDQPCKILYETLKAHDCPKSSRPTLAQV